MGTTVVPCITVVTCYTMWCVHGCSWFLPFLSDLGMHGVMGSVFCGGLVITAILLTTTNIDAFYVRCCLTKGRVRSKLLYFMNCLSAMTGVVVALGVGGLGFFPWDKDVKHHMMCAGLIFYGGASWASFNLVWQWAMLKLSRPHKCLQLGAVILSWTCLKLMDYYFGLAEQNGIGLFKRLHRAKDNFGGYCREKHFDEMSFAAVFEWLNISSLILSITTLQADFASYFSSSMSTMPLEGYEQLHC